MKIVVRNLSFKTTKAELKGLFVRHGDVARVRLAAVVTMPDTAQATKAVKALRGYTLQGRVLTVREMRPKAIASQVLRRA
jgi:RNA recognition motif-containing protein